MDHTRSASAPVVTGDDQRDQQHPTRNPSGHRCHADTGLALPATA